jgi:hypothetical protein
MSAPVNRSDAGRRRSPKKTFTLPSDVAEWIEGSKGRMSASEFVSKELRVRMEALKRAVIE